MRSSVKSSFSQIGDNERGIVLVLCLFMLLLLTLLGAFATSTSMTELSIAGNYRNAETALNVADSGAAFAEGNSTIYITIGNGSWPTPGTGTGTNPNDNAVAVGNSAADVRVDYIATGPVQPGHLIQVNAVNGFQANYFAITSTGAGPNNSQARVETQIEKIVPKQ